MAYGGNNMKCIVAVDSNWAIGKNNQLLVSIPADMRFFKEQTMNKVVIMGRNTLASFPGGKPLKNPHAKFCGSCGQPLN